MTKKPTSTKIETAGVQKEVLEYLHRQPDVFVVRVRPSALGNKGVSDCILCYRGQFIGIEFKRDLHGSYGVTKPQEIRGRQIKKAGGRWHVVDSLPQVKSILDGVNTTSIVNL